jgi:hypothetical protein
LKTGWTSSSRMAQADFKVSNLFRFFPIWRPFFKTLSSSLTVK